MVELMEERNVVDLLYCNLVGKVIQAFGDLSEIWRLIRMQAVLELEMIHEFAVNLEGFLGTLIHHIVIDEQMWFGIFFVLVVDRS